MLQPSPALGRQLPLGRDLVQFKFVVAQHIAPDPFAESVVIVRHFDDRS